MANIYNDPDDPREAERRQREQQQGFATPAMSAPPAAAPARTATTSVSQYEALIQKYAAQYGVDPKLVRAVIQAESGGNARAQSGAGAQGLMQLMPATAQALGVTDPFDVEQNIRAGVQYLAEMQRRYNGDVVKTLAAYNAGPGNVDKYGGVPPFEETQRYVKTVTGYMEGDAAPAGAPAQAAAPKSGYANPVAGRTGKAQAHWGQESAKGGTDIFAERGTPVQAMRSGTVVSASYSDVGGYNVLIRGDDGMMYYYAHMGEDLAVKTGDKVTAGARIGSVSDTGNAQGTQPHLHLGVGKDIKEGTGAEGGVGTDFDLVGALNETEDGAGPKTASTGDLDEYDAENEKRQGFGAPTPEQIEEAARKKREREEMEAAAARRSRWGSFIEGQIGQPYRFEDEEQSRWNW